MGKPEQIARRDSSSLRKGPSVFSRRLVGNNVWFGRPEADSGTAVIGRLPVNPIRPEVLETEQAVGAAMLEELLGELRQAEAVGRDLVIVLLGGRGAQAMHRRLGDLARAGTADPLLRRLHVFTQDALAPMRADNSLNFIRDFERLLGSAFFSKVKSFTQFQTADGDLEAALREYLERLDSLGGADIFFMGLGPEPEGSSHLAYIKPGSGATAADIAGIIPISPRILDHHIAKFKAGGSAVTPRDEAECRKATHIITLGPAAILSSKKVVQSIVDAVTAPGKKQSYRRLIETELSGDPAQRAVQLDENPGLWLRLHPNVRSLILPDVLGE